MISMNIKQMQAYLKLLQNVLKWISKHLFVNFCEEHANDPFDVPPAGWLTSSARVQNFDQYKVATPVATHD